MARWYAFRNLKDNVDKAVKLFSNTNAPEALGFVLRAPFEDVKKELNTLCHTFLTRYPDMASVDRIQNEYNKRAFILAFRDIIKKRSEIQIYEEFDADDPAWEMTDQQFNDYRSKYLDMTLGLSLQRMMSRRRGQKIRQAWLQKTSREKSPT